MNKIDLVTKLSNGEYTVTFTKKDGTDRKMRCTLLESRIPKEKAPKGISRKENDEVLPVFDLDLGEWRSFRLDSVKEVV